jgi:(1->4)-alpha-D-glucan 1-alpha-D-glucosylmutase
VANRRPIATATYRLQVHAGFDLHAVRRIVPYLARLGVSHVYLSPILQARPDSRHGYDVVDPTKLDPKLGTPADLAALVRTLRRHDMGLVLDVVPNHMAIGPHNRYWTDVLTHGEASQYARWFDIAWRTRRGRPAPIHLPVLGDVRSRVLARGELGLVWEAGRFRVRYFDHRFPLDPAAVAPLVEAAARAAGASRELGPVADALRALPSRDLPAPTGDRAREADVPLARLAALADRDPRIAAALSRAAARTRGPTLAALLERQPYRLVYWRRGAGDINYRRFFAVSELVGLRVEDAAVFAATHARLRAWTAARLVDVLRVDHVDGLADPLAYLRALRRLLDGAGGRDVGVLVEKILMGDEQVRAEWPVAGTTGYEVARALDDVFIDRRGFAAIVAWYARAIAAGAAGGFQAIAWAGKRDMAASWLAPDVRRLVDLAPDPPARIRGPALRDAIVELLVAMPVYRTYVDGRRGSPSRADRALVTEALAIARRRGRATASALRWVAEQLLLPGPLGARGPFVRRFQQTSGALMAKGVEDTALYRWAPLASRNEVGTDPSGSLRGAVERLHAHFAIRARRFPDALSAVTTHDTKRSADTRARLDVLAEMPARWTGLVAAWRARHRAWRPRIDGRRAPDAATEYLIYQTAVAIGAGADVGTLDSIRERVRAAIRKSCREAAVQTSWLEPAPAFEDAVDAFVVALFASDAFRADLRALGTAIARPALWTALARTVLQLTAPGVPDVYQGDELWRFLLVDPDNRGDVDFARRTAWLDGLARAPVDPALARALAAAPEDGRIKLHVVHRTLALRRAATDVFRGAYVPLERGAGRLGHVVAFARIAAGRAALIVVPRLVVALTRGRAGAPIGPVVWRDTTLDLPPALAGRRWTNAYTGETLAPGDTLRIADALASFPVGVWWSMDSRLVSSLGAKRDAGAARRSQPHTRGTSRVWAG